MSIRQEDLITVMKIWQVKNRSNSESAHVHLEPDNYRDQLNHLKEKSIPNTSTLLITSAPMLKIIQAINAL